MGKFPKFILSALVVFLSTAFPLAAQVRYFVADLGTLDGQTSTAFSINEKCQIVGSAASANEDWHAALFDPRGVFYNVDLGTIGGSSSSAISINDIGQIVGFAAEEEFENWLATLFDTNGTRSNISLGATENYTQSYANAVNNNGYIVGWSIREEYSGLNRAVLFDHTGNKSNIDLGSLVDNTESWSQAYCINDNNQIAGMASDSNGMTRAVLFDPTGKWENNRDLGTLGGDYGTAYANNNLGQIVGNSFRADDDANAIATLFVVDDNNIDLGTLGGKESSARAINNLGQIVGYADVVNDGMHAAMFDPTGNEAKNIDLNNLIATDSDWTLIEAISINDKGWIVGNGACPDGLHGFLLIPIAENLGQFAMHWLESDCENNSWCQGADLNFSGTVNFADYAIHLRLWAGSQPYKNIPPCDYDRNGTVGIADIAIFLEKWLEDRCAADKNCDGTDFDRGGSVNFDDFALCARQFGGL